MRLVCPNCSAQYEVDAAVIPDEGRDVLCSNCGHAWFQLSERQLEAQSADEQAEAVTAPDANLAAPAPEPAAAPTAEPEPSHVDDAAEAAALTAASVQIAAEEAVAVRVDAAPDTRDVAPEIAHEIAHEDATEEDFTAPVAPSAAARRALDDDMLSVLREEAAREAEARRAEGTSIEMQPELGLPEAEHPMPTIETVGAATIRALRRHDEDLHDDEEPEAIAPVQRKALLPDIEEINSTLTASSQRPDLPSHQDDLDRRRNRSGFRAGFSVALLIALALLLLYITAPRLSQSLPALAPALDRYVASVDAGRIWLDARLRSPEPATTN